MRIVINDTPVALGEPLAEAACREAGLRRPPLWRRLTALRPGALPHLMAEDCEVQAFDGRFHLYPCTHGYLNADRQWHTTVNVRLREGRVDTIELRVVEGRYAATEFVDRFREVCTDTHGEGLAVDRYTRRWRNGAATFLSCLQPDRRNACFVFGLLDA